MYCDLAQGFRAVGTTGFNERKAVATSVNHGDPWIVASAQATQCD